MNARIDPVYAAALGVIAAAFLMVSPLRAAEEEKTAHGGDTPQERAEAAKHVDDILRDHEELEARWKETKDKYKKEMGDHVNVLEAALEERQNALDYGNPEIRKQIAEHIEDLSRAKADIEGELTELSAAGGINLTQAKGDLERTINDLKD